MARAVGGTVTTVDLSRFKFEMAAGNFARSGFAAFIVQMQGDTGKLLARQKNDAFDLIFLDSERPEYPGW
jgi:predicted O-methyltransferase YrrM